MAEVEARLPKPFKFLFESHRYKVAHGGRFGLKSWSYARALLIRGSMAPRRVLCTREVQKSIRESVHQLLADQIETMGMGGFYEVLRDEIRGKNGTKFLFAGLSDLTAESIKSFEGIDDVWVEEARAVTKRSWGILIPTIRKDGSEIWVSFNAELDSDETYQRFVVNPPPDAVVVKTTYRDAKEFGVFPPEMERERLHLQKTDPVAYDNVWEGNCRSAVEGAIYANEVTKAREENRFTNLPYDPKLKVHVVCDLGFNDKFFAILVQKQLSELRIIDCIEDSHRTLDSYSAELRDKRLNWGTMYLPHDAKHKTLAAAGKSTQDLMIALGWKTDIVPDVGIEPGIKIARMALPRTYMDKTKAARLIECLKRYRRGIPSTTGEPGAPVHDEYSHGADAYRYLSIVADKLTNEGLLSAKPIKYPKASIA